MAAAYHFSRELPACETCDDDTVSVTETKGKLYYPLTRDSGLSYAAILTTR